MDEIRSVPSSRLHEVARLGPAVCLDRVVSVACARQISTDRPLLVVSVPLIVAHRWAFAFVLVPAEDRTSEFDQGTWRIRSGRESTIIGGR